MIWLVWRQHRSQVYFAAAALAAFAVLLLVTGLQMASQYHAALVSCAASGTCGSLQSTLTLGSPPMVFLVLLSMAVPAVLGVFWGAPLVARELELGTSQFAWMQSVTRQRWLAAKTGWTLLAAAAWGGAVSALVTWWSGPENALKHQNFRPGQFDIQGIVPVGYALFAVALGIAVGTLVRRVLPALAITLGVFAGVRFLIAYFVRPHYLTAITTTSSVSSRAEPTGSYWRLSQGVIGPDGRVFQDTGLAAFLGSTRVTIPGRCRLSPHAAHPGRFADRVACLSAHGYHGFLTYQPAGRYWPFQGIETGIFVLLAAVLIAVTARLVIRRDG
jgi:ABC-type transport system involved in multi-copper enzyme maturation permease subunit